MLGQKQALPCSAINCWAEWGGTTAPCQRMGYCSRAILSGGVTLIDPVSRERQARSWWVLTSGEGWAVDPQQDSFHLGSAPRTALPLAPAESLQAKARGVWPLACAGQLHHCSPEASTVGLRVGLFPTAWKHQAVCFQRSANRTSNGTKLPRKIWIIVKVTHRTKMLSTLWCYHRKFLPVTVSTAHRSKGSVSTSVLQGVKLSV